MGHQFSILHLSDLHFGRINPSTLEHLEQFIRQRKDEINLAILTGDLTQRAKRDEFLAAKEFLTALPSPLFLVPGNHDVPLYNLFLRFIYPYKKFMNFLGPFAQNFYEDEKVIVCGLWTTDKFTVQKGKLRSQDLELVEKKFKEAHPEKIRIIASHHPLSSNDIEKIRKHSPHFIFWGHEHQSGIYPIDLNERFPMVLASGTSISSRTRTEANSFNYLTFDNEKYHVEIYRHSKILGAFEVIDRKSFLLS